MPRKMTLSRTTRSKFARAIASLLDDTDFLKRSDWAEVLHISTPAISQWVNDVTLPRPDLLRMVLRMLRDRGGNAAKDALAQFDRIASLPATEVSPLAHRLGNSVAEYLGRKDFRDDPADDDDFEDGELDAVISSEKAPIEISINGCTAGQNPWAVGNALRLNRDDFAVSTRLRRLSAGDETDRYVGWFDLPRYPRVVVTGGPGIGKSFMASKLAKDFVTRNGRQPFLLNICTLNYAFPSESLEEALGPPISDGRLIIIDALDEVQPEARREMATALGHIAQRKDWIHFLIVSRPVPELALFDDFTAFEVAPLSDIEVITSLNEAVRGQAVASQEELRVFFCHLSERRNVWDFLRNPTFLMAAWNLFLHNAMTPFWEGEIFSESVRRLVELDQAKGLTRVRQPWASAKHLFALLGMIAFKMLCDKKIHIRREEVIDLVTSRTDSSNTDELVNLLIVQGLLAEEFGEYRFLHRTLMTYFAARFVVDSTTSAITHLSGWSEREDLQEVLRLACSISDDATSLLQNVLDSQETEELRYTMLAGILAQPLQAEPLVMLESCKSVVNWLDGRFVDWSIDKAHTERDEPKGKQWRLRAICKHARYDVNEQITLKAIHRARSGPAKDLLKSCLQDATSPFLVVFAHGLDVEGKLDVEVKVQNASARLDATIDELRLV